MCYRSTLSVEPVLHHMLRRLLPIVSIRVVFATTPAIAASAVVRDGHTIQLDVTVYRLDDIDAPALDQTCIDDYADPWTCGIEARAQLPNLINGRNLRCDDLGLDKTKL